MYIAGYWGDKNELSHYPWRIPSTKDRNKDEICVQADNVQSTVFEKAPNDYREIKNSFRPFKNKSPMMATKITFIGCSLCASSAFSTSLWIILHFRTNEVGTVIICAYQIKLRKINCLEWKSPAPRRPDRNKHIHQSYLSKEQNDFLPLPEDNIRMKTATASRKQRQPD